MMKYSLKTLIWLSIISFPLSGCMVKSKEKNKENTNSTVDQKVLDEKVYELENIDNYTLTETPVSMPEGAQYARIQKVTYSTWYVEQTSIDNSYILYIVLDYDRENDIVAQYTSEDCITWSKNVYTEETMQQAYKESFNQASAGRFIEYYKDAVVTQDGKEYTYRYSTEEQTQIIKILFTLDANNQLTIKMDVRQTFIQDDYSVHIKMDVYDFGDTTFDVIYKS